MQGDSWKGNMVKGDRIASIGLAALAVIWLWLLDGTSQGLGLLENQRSIVYATAASMLGSLLGFSIAAIAIVVAFVGMPKLALIRQNVYFPQLLLCFSLAIRALAAATVVSLVCLLWDRDSSPQTWCLYLLAVTLPPVVIRFARAVWLLEKVVMLVAKPDARGTPLNDTLGGTDV